MSSSQSVLSVPSVLSVYAIFVARFDDFPYFCQDLAACVETDARIAPAVWRSLSVWKQYKEKQRMLPSHIKTLVERRFGKTIRYSSDIEALSYDIEASTGLSVSVNTLKRLWGIVCDVKKPRLYTLDIIAKYIGADTWDDLANNKLEDNCNSGFNRVDVGDAVDIGQGDIVEFSYKPDRKVVCRCVGGNSFLVVSAENSKLMPGDKIEVEHFVLNYPLMVRSVVRDGVQLGRFTAGKTSGITSLHVVKAK